jgi:hypothetical protein
MILQKGKETSPAENFPGKVTGFTFSRAKASAVAFHACPPESMKARMSSTLQTVTRGASFIG